METILLTGAAGFIGSKTAQVLLDQGFAVVGLDNLNDYYDVRLKQHRLNHLRQNQNFSFYQVDIENLEALDELFAGNSFKAVLNLAARAGVRYSMENPHVYMTTNSHGTLNLLEMMKYEVKKWCCLDIFPLCGQAMPF
jgi:nucleoside-diphosphate-sugar epimerase